VSDERTQAEAVLQVQHLVRALRASGWDFAMVSLWRRDEGPNVFHGAGASYWEASRAILPAVPRIADNTRVLARELDEAHRLTGAPDVADGCSQVIDGTSVDERARRAREGAG